MMKSQFNEHDYTLSILAGTRDVNFLESMVRHISAVEKRATWKQLVIDGLSPQDSQTNTLRDLARSLQERNLINEILELNSSDERYIVTARSCFGKTKVPARDFRDVPLLAWAFGLDVAPKDWVVHYDCDNLVYQEAEFSWVEEGIRLMESAPEVLFVAPLPGPPTFDGHISQPGETMRRDERGFFAFKTFSSRCFLTNKQRLKQILPLQLEHASRRHRIQSLLPGRSSVWNWEYCVSQALKKSQFERVHLSSPQSWALHCPDHGPQFQRQLPKLIAQVEAGIFPANQAGKYDLDLTLWADQT